MHLALYLALSLLTNSIHLANTNIVVLPHYHDLGVLTNPPNRYSNWNILVSTNLKTWSVFSNYTYYSIFTNVIQFSNRLTGAITPFKTNVYTNVIVINTNLPRLYVREQFN